MNNKCELCGASEVCVKCAQGIHTEIGVDMSTEEVPEWEKRREERSATATKNLNRLWPVLEDEAIKRVESRYDGSGDSGDYYGALYIFHDESKKVAPGKHGYWDIPDDAIQWEDAPRVMQTVNKSQWDEDKKQWKSEVGDVERSLHDAIDEAAYEIVNKFEAGWENNEGGYGAVTFDVENKRVIVEHSQNVIVTEDSRYEIGYSDASV